MEFWILSHLKNLTLKLLGNQIIPEDCGDWKNFNREKCVEIFFEKKSYDDAQSYCKQFTKFNRSNPTLLEIYAEDETDELISYNYTNPLIWIGFNDRGKSKGKSGKHANNIKYRFFWNFFKRNPETRNLIE